MMQRRVAKCKANEGIVVQLWPNPHTVPMAVIIEGLRPLAVSVDRLQLDAENANHGDVPAIRRSLNAFGQRKPIVVKRTGTDDAGQPTGIVIAGNHTLLGALDLGWDEVAAVFVDDDPMTARAYALADNRVAQLASWEQSQLVEHVRALSTSGLDMESLGWSEAELAQMLGNPSDLTEFKAYDEAVANDLRTTTCPECGHEFPI